MKENNDKNYISLKIKKEKKNKVLYVRRKVEHSELKKYDNILDAIYQIVNDKIDNSINIYLEMYLYHKDEKLKKIIIYNKEEWNFLYNYNIIDECISKDNQLKIDYKVYTQEEKVDEKIKANNFKKIISYILENIPYEFYLNSLYNFFKDKKDIEELFKIYLINQLMETNLKDIKKNSYLNDDVKSKDLEKINNNNSENININKNYEKYLIDSEEFLNIFKNNINQISKKSNFLKNIKNIIYNNDEKELKDSLENKTISNSLNLITKKKYFERMNENENLFNFQSLLVLKNEYKNNILEENNFFKLLNNEEYNTGIEQLKNKLYKNIYNI